VPVLAKVAASFLPIWPDFAHPGYDQFAFAVENGFGGLNKGLVKTVWEAAGFL
jgi:hypothetical protein